jgi:hypothetical protein
MTQADRERIADEQQEAYRRAQGGERRKAWRKLVLLRAAAMKAAQQGRAS